jgi:ubiquinone/menaquinone biosynthesis C-methylase UbiE
MIGTDQTMLDLPRYWLAHGTRVGWFLGQYLAAARLTGRVAPPPTRPTPRLGELLADLLALLREDAANIAAGLYRRPRDLVRDPIAWLSDAALYFTDLPQVNARRRRGGSDEVPRRTARAALPDYYTRNFHFQTDGYLSEHSARLYDQQVEVLFIGGADTMRRQALVPIAAWMQRRRTKAATMLDIACGTGRFLGSLGDNFPAASLIGIDLSRPYLEEAARFAGGAGNPPRLIEGSAERLPLADASVDIISMIYLLHEVPDGVRDRIAAECARVLRPGGRLVVVDSLQYGDMAGFDGLLDNFPAAFHEPFYALYAGADLAALFGAAGLSSRGVRQAFLSKVFAFDRE